MKRIVIECYTAAIPYVGLGEFCRKLGTGLGKRAADLRKRYGIELYFIVPPSHRGYFGKEVHYLCIPVAWRRWLKLYPFRVDLFHLPHQYCLLKSWWRAKHQLMTIHDINFVYEKKGNKLERSFRRMESKLEAADHLNYISQFVQEDVHKHFRVQTPERVIYNGVTDLSASVTPCPNLESRLPPHFLFHISSLLPKKNIHLLVEMMRYLPEENLVIAGDWDNPYARELKERVEQLPVSNVYPLSNVTEQEKAWLYASCRAFLFPSLCEGFGLPPVEAMKFGKPVFLSTLTSLPEIGGKDAFYWHELKPEAMAEEVRQKLPLFYADSRNALLMKQNADRFDWDTCVDEYIRYYLDILAL